jgi:anti-sigma-K factor RskA
LAACLVMVVVWVFQASPGIPAKFMANLHRNANAVNGNTDAIVPLGFEVNFDLRASTMRINPLAVPPRSRREYQLWLQPPGSVMPISLGVIPLARPTTSPWPATYPPSDLMNVTLAVSLEPFGGSPKAVPTGPMMFVGKLVQAMP